MKMRLLLSVVFFQLIPSFGQVYKLELSSQRMSDKSVEISYKKTSPGYLTVVLDFSELSNTFTPEKIHSIEGSQGSLITLKPTNSDQPILYRYSYTSIIGKLNPKIDLNFCYLLPYMAGTPCEVAEAGLASERYFGTQKPADWKSYVFFTQKEEIVTAIRKGVVIEIVDKYEHDTQVEFTTKQNIIIVEHEDGSLVRYLGLKKGSLKVNLGDEVLPNTPLGSNTPRGKNRFGVSIFMYYLSSVDFESLRGQTIATQKSLYSIITPKFVVDNHSCIILENRNKYTSFTNKEMITKEMSKRELKKYNAK